MSNRDPVQNNKGKGKRIRFCFNIKAIETVSFIFSDACDAKPPLFIINC
jgi:hypothetical protein